MKKNSKAIVFLAGLVLSLPYAAPGWQTTLVDYPGGASLVALDPLGNPVVFGSAEIPPSSSVWRLAKFAKADGTLLWTREISGTRDMLGATARSIDIDNGGNVLAAGFTDNILPEGTFTVVKVDGTTGALLWRNPVSVPGTPAGERNGDAWSVRVDSADDVVAAGTWGHQGSAANFVVVKLSGIDGTEVWRAEINGTEIFSPDEAVGLAIDPAGNVVAIGLTTDVTTRTQVTVAKFDGTNGALLWRHDILGDTPLPMGEQPGDPAVLVDAAGDVVAVGSTNNSATGRDFAVAKLDGATGNELWRQELDGGVTHSCAACKSDVATMVTLDSTGAIVAGGQSNNQSGTGDFTIVKLLASNGNIIWRRDVEGNEGATAQARALSVDSADDIIATSSTIIDYSSTFTIFKLSGSDGSAVWTRVGGGDGFRDVAVDSDGAVIAAGGTGEVGSPGLMTVLKVSGTDGTDFLSTICGDGLVTAPEECDDGNMIDADGCSPVCEDQAATEIASGGSEVLLGSAAAAKGGGAGTGPVSVTTDTESDGPTSADPVETTVTSPGPGAVSIEERAPTIPAPAGYRFLSQEVFIEAPTASAGAPLMIELQIHRSRLPTGVDETTLQILHGQTPVPPCTGAPGTAAPDPCISARTLLGDGSIEISVLSSTAGTWRFAVDACGPRPQAGCFAPVRGQKNQLQLKVKLDPLKSSLSWKRTKEPITPKALFGSPLTTTNYDLCLYDGTSNLIGRVSMPAGGTCALGKPCWKENASSFKYANKTVVGNMQLVLKEGLEPGKAKIGVRGKGPLADIPPLPLVVAPYRVQLKNSDGECWEAIYSTHVKNDGAQFKANAD